MSLPSLCDQWTRTFSRCAHRLQIPRNGMLIVTLWMTWDSYQWAKGYVSLHSEKSGADLGLAVGAVLAAISALQAIVFGQYVTSRPEREADELAPGTMDRRTHDCGDVRPDAR